MFRPDLQDALRDRDAVLRSFLAADGTLTSIPTKIRKRLVILDLLSQQFEPGERYDETQVNNRLRAFHPDVAALRRYLVEEGFLDRADGFYWRSGGTVDCPRRGVCPRHTAYARSGSAEAERLAEPALRAVGLETGLDGGSRARRRPAVHP